MAFKSDLCNPLFIAPRRFGVGKFGVGKFDNRDNTRYSWVRAAGDPPSFNTGLCNPLFIAPRRFGVGKFGVGKFDNRDNTRYSWVRATAAAAILLFFSIGASAQVLNPYCDSEDVLTTNGFCKPAVDVEGTNRWGDKYNWNWDNVETVLNSVHADTGTLAALIAAVSASTSSLVLKSGDTMTGGLIVSSTGAAGYSVVVSSGIDAGTGTVRAAAFSGNGSALTGVVPVINASVLGSNPEVRLASADFVQTTTQSFTLTNLGVQVSSTLFRLQYDCWTASQSYNVLTFNNDKSAVYFYTDQGVNAGSTALQQQGLAHGALLGVSSVNQRSTFGGEIIFSVAYSSSATTVDFSTMRARQITAAQTFPTPFSLAGNYNGTGAITSVQISQATNGVPTNSTTPDNVGTANCHLELFKRSSWP